MGIIFKILLSFAFAVELPLSPFDPKSQVDSYAETASQRFLVQYDLKSNQFFLYVVDKANRVPPQKLIADRRMYLDGGSRIVHFELGGEKAELFIPARPGISSLDNFGNKALLRVGGKDVMALYSSIYPLEKEAMSHLIELYSPAQKQQFAASGKFPTFEFSMNDEGPCARLVGKIRGLFGRK